MFLLKLTPFLVAAVLSAQAPTIEQSLRLQTAATPRMSPDGRFVAYAVTEADWEEDAFNTQIWMAMTTTGEHYQLTKSKRSSTDPRWSPDSKRLAFLSDRDGSKQIYMIAPAGGEATQITHFEGGVEAFAWSPDGHRIAFSSNGPVRQAQKDRRDKYGDFEVVGADYTRRQLWTLRVDDDKAKPEPLTTGDDFSVAAFAWSPDSSKIAFSAAKDPVPSSAGTTNIYVVRLSDKYVKKLAGEPGPDLDPLWSPDGSEVAYETVRRRESYMYENRSIAIVPASGGAPRIIGQAFDETPRLAAWTQMGIYFEASEKTAEHLFRVNPSNGAIERVSAPVDEQVANFTFSADSVLTAFLCAGPNRYAEVCFSPTARFAPQKLTNLSDQLKTWKLASRAVFSWKSKDGTRIEGILIKPPDFDPSKKYPLLVVIHGGPVNVDRPSIAPDRNYPVEMFAAKGAVILRPNYRGSAGYGERFRSLNVRNLGVGDAEDVLSGVDALIAEGFIDKDRVGAMGWSQGGYISAFLGMSTNRFKAVSVGAGISDWTTYYVNTDLQPFTRQYLEATPWQDPEIYHRTSPIAYVNTASTPTLIQHGDQDKRVPIPNGYELRQALEDRGVPVKMIVYQGLGHAINKPKQQLAVMEHNYQWFSQWIWGETPPK